jgi:acyl-CoA reductase-like NAD-dependent aldehyde dehydrogenase
MHMPKLVTRNPFTQEITGEFENDTFELAKAKVLSLRKNQKIWSEKALSDRLDLVKSALDYFDSNRELIATDICEQMGRPLHQARGEIKGLLERGNYLCSIAESVLSPDQLNDKPEFDRSIEHVPLGLIFVISAWNYPLLITINSVVPALIAGNAVLLKHSSLTPKIGQHFEKAFGVLGGNGVLNQIIVDHGTTGRIIEELAVDHVVFTGSVSGGKSILKHTSQKFMMPALELGGKDAAYVHGDADIAQAVDTVVDGAMFNAGQSCCGIERAYVHKDVYDDFLIQATKLVGAYKLGDPKEEATTLGPLAQASSAKLMSSQIQEAVQRGAKILMGGKVQNIKQGTFFEATLISEVENDMKVMQEENFGPILAVMKVDGLEQAIDLVNDSPYGLTSAIFTRDIGVAKKFSERVNTGTVFMNRCDYLDPALPWTGVKDSGCGSTLSKYGFYGVTRRKALHFKK